MWGALVIAVASAALFATGSSLQHRAAGSTESASKIGLLTGLLARREWLVGSLLSAAAFALHVTALHLGSLTLVQPVIVTGIVFTVIVRSVIDRHRPAVAEIAWAAVTWVGLVLFIATLGSGVAHQPDPGRALLITAGVAVAAAVLVLLAHRSRRPARRGALLAAAAGLLFGLVAGLVKLCTTTASTSGWRALALSWPPWLLIVAGVGAVALNQLAYRSTRLSLTAPVLNIVQLLIAMTFGFIVFSERILDTPISVVAQLVGLAAMVIGVVQLAARAGRSTSAAPAHAGSPPNSAG